MSERGSWSRAIRGIVVHYWPEKNRAKEGIRKMLCGADLAFRDWMIDTNARRCRRCQERYERINEANNE